MSADATLWLTFILIGLATTLPRASFIVLGSRVRLPSVVQRALRYAPAAALAAIVTPDVLVVAGGNHPTHYHWLQAHSPRVIGRIMRVPESFDRLLADADRDLGCGSDACLI